MRLIFMGTPDFAVATLERLVKDGYEISAVFTQPDKPAGRGHKLQLSPVKRFALEQGLKVYQPQKLKTNVEVHCIFERLEPDACIVAAYGKILPPWLLAIPRLGCINVHASLLPKYRGAAPINWAIANGETETGVTIMQMDQGMDTGPMLARKTLAIGPDEVAPELSARLAEAGAELLSRILPRVEHGEMTAVPQDEREATYAPLLKPEHGLIDWQMTAREIANRVRAFQPWPRTYTHLNGRRLIILKAHPAPSDNRLDLRAVPTSTIVSIGKENATVICGDSTLLCLEELQIEGKSRQSARDFVNGLRLKIGDQISDTYGI